ncbi:MAG: MBL fold metallo-hydrolase [Chlamydiales bacterium]|nr:MBL fold metallo-hydrolase [Chlamydiales bacterium]
MNNELLFLGTGASAGVPVIGCRCKVCTSTSACNKRLRPSLLIKAEGKTFIIDVGPDFREQALKYKIEHLDGVLLTHSHYDHIGGIDDLRAYYFLQKKRMPCLLSQETFDELKVRYYYMMKPMKDGHGISAQLDFFVLEKEDGEVEFEGVKWQYMSYIQADMKVTGFRLGSMAYVSDIRKYEEGLFHSLKGVDLLILSALRSEPTHMHFSIEEAVAFSKKVGAKQTWLTHISHDLDHEEVSQKLPHNVRLSYDGLQISF